MLVLSRKVGERILVGDDIRITIVRIGGGGVRVGIEAPPTMNVVREELKERAAAGQIAAGQTASEPAAAPAEV